MHLSYSLSLPSLSAAPKIKHLYLSLKEQKTHKPWPIQGSTSYRIE